MTCQDCGQDCGHLWNVCGYLLNVMSTCEADEARRAYCEEQVKIHDEKLWSDWDYINFNIRKKGCKAVPGAARREKKEPKKSDRWFVTVGLKPGADIIKAWQRTLKFIKMAKVTRAYAQMDQSGEEDVKHPHIHIYVEYDKEMFKGKIIQVFGCAFTDYIGGESHVDAQLGGEYHEKYFKGEKCEEKLAIVAKSRKWREENNLPQYIERDAQERILSYALADLPPSLHEANRTSLQDET